MPTPKPRRQKAGNVRWQVRFRHQGRQTSEMFDSLADAERFCVDIENRGIDHAMRVHLAILEQEAREKAATVDEHFERFIEHTAHRVRSDRTIKDYRTEWRRYVSPTLGSIPLPMLAKTDVQKWVDGLTAGTIQPRVRIVDGERTFEPISPKSIAARHALLHAVIKHAIRQGELAADPCEGVDLPKRRPAQPKGLRPAEWQALRAALRQINPDACDLAEFLLGTGWRWGEATALSTYDVEDDGQTVHVTVTRVMRRGAEGRPVIVQDAKSAAGLDRRVQLDTEVAQLVRRRVQAARPGSLVFTTSTGAPWHHSHFRNRYWSKAVDVAGLHRRPTPHWLRHTHVAWMLMTQQANLTDLQKRIGHASYSTTVNVYGRMIADVSGDALDAFAAMRSADPKKVEQAAPDAVLPPSPEDAPDAP